MNITLKPNEIAAITGHVARGKHGAENLTQDDAKRVFHALIQPDADPLQLGAFLIAMRMKGETSAELAGFVEAVRQSLPDFGQFTAPSNSVDLPCYAGKRRGSHVYLAAALKARDAGIPVFIHGVADIPGRITAIQLLQQQGIRQAHTLSEASRMLSQDGIAYMTLDNISPLLLPIYQLRNRLGVRSFANTVARLLNPLQCSGQLNGVFHTPYVETMTNTNILLQQARSMIFMGTEGDPELFGSRQKLATKQVGNQLEEMDFPDCEISTYPRDALEHPEQLLKDFERLTRGEFSAYEQAAFERMQQAFCWASSGN